jgi:hypothetical protein
LSDLRRFATVCRNFGIGVAVRVAFSKLRGRLWPLLALRDAPAYATPRRELSILLSTIDHDAATVEAIVDALAARGSPDWEICISERPPTEPRTIRALERLRGTQPWFRVISTERSHYEATAARWTTEQATGEFIALLAPGHCIDTVAIARLLVALNDGGGCKAAVLLEGDCSSDKPLRTRVVLQRKSDFLAFLPHGRISAPALAEYLDHTGVRVVRAYVSPNGDAR